MLKPTHNKIQLPNSEVHEEIELFAQPSDRLIKNAKLDIQNGAKLEDIKLRPQPIQDTDEHSRVPIPARRQSSIYRNQVFVQMDQKDQELSMSSIKSAKKEPSKVIVSEIENFKYDAKDWHLFTQQQIFEQLRTRRHGLTDEDAFRRNGLFGENVITPPKKTHWFVKFVKALIGGFQSMMIVGSILCFIVFGISDGTDIQTLALALVLILVVLLTTIFQQYQEGQSEKTMEALKALAPQNCMVERNNVIQEIPAAELTIGDIVHVRGGDKVPADVRVLEASDLKVNNAALTGENVDIKLGPEANHELLYEAKNVARSGCNFTSGTGVCVVYSIGDNTFFGEISKNTTQIKRPDTLIKHEIERLIKFMSCFAIILGVGFLIAALVIGYAPLDAIVFVIGIIVANVPEGLLPQMTVALTITAKRMLGIGVLVQNLDIIETLGAVTVICSDKTGTLTCNRMSVSHVVYNMEIFESPLTPSMVGDKFRFYDTASKSFLRLLKNTILNTDAIFLSFEDDILKRSTKGDASESAIIKFLEPVESVAPYREKVKRVAAIPFNSTNKWMMSICENDGPNSEQFPYTMYVKGAPEKIFLMCTKLILHDQLVDIDEQQLEKLMEINEILAKRGERVLAFSQVDLPADKYPKGFQFETDGENQNIFAKDLVFVGLYSLIDPPRASVKPAIQLCNKAGVQVFMVTGDHPITAHAIAKSLDLITGPTQEEIDAGEAKTPEGGVYSIVVHGAEITHFTEQDWSRVLAHKEIVFARTMPSQKQTIVQELSKLGHILAMTGDGVNDAPALKAAHVGIAMGSGSAVAKEAGQIILMNDDFGNIVDGIKEGRLIFENLKKCIAYVLISNVPEIVPFLLFIILKIPIAIETIVILLIDIGTDLVPTVCLAYEDPEDIIMEVPPRSKDSHLISPSMMGVCYGFLGMFETIAAFFAFFYTFADYGMSFDDSIGSGIGFRTPYEDLDNDQRDFFTKLCLKNEYYQREYVQGRGYDCNENYSEFRSEILGMAQAAFFLTVVWGQFANNLTRKTTLQTIFTVERFFGNKPVFLGFLSEVFVFLFFVYIPGINSAFLMVQPTSSQATCGMWIFPFMIIYEELRKWWIRNNKGGFIDRMTRF